jgi:hypothetical protein
MKIDLFLSYSFCYPRVLVASTSEKRAEQEEALVWAVLARQFPMLVVMTDLRKRVQEFG